MKKNTKLNTNVIITPMPAERLFIDMPRWQVPIDRVAVVEPFFTPGLEVVFLQNHSKWN